jgi:integrase
MAIMGWPSATMATRYQHILDSILKGVAGQIGSLLWDDPANDKEHDDGDDGATGVPVPT